MNLKFLVAPLILLPLVIANAEEPGNLSQYVGLTYPPLKDGLKEESGNMIGDPINNTNYSVAFMSNEGSNMLWLESSSSRNIKGLPIWKVLDVIAAPNYGKDETLIIGFCKIDDRSDSEVLAVVKYEQNKKYFNNVIKAWRANRAKGKFESITTKGISCLNESYGE
jgi:hypothetical protein